MTTLAPLPGRGAEPDEGTSGSSGHLDRAVLDDPAPAPAPVPSPVSTAPGPAPAGADTVDLTPHRPKPPDSDIGGQAAWLFGLALALLTEGVAERVAMAEVLAEAAGRSRALEGAYGRAVALVNEFPGDPVVHRTVDLLAKALLRSRRPSRAAEEA
jgi:hypothetical protein